MPINNLPDIYFIRHGQTNWNAEGRYQGQKDIALNDFGRAQAKDNGVLLADLFAKNNMKASDVDWSVSPLSRAIETMDIVQQAFSSDTNKVQIDNSLIEVSFGEFEGFLHNDLTSSFAKRGERGDKFWQFRPKNGESYVDLLDRVTPFITSLKKPSVIVSHGGIARVFRHLVTNYARVKTINWSVPQDAILQFSNAKMKLHK